MLFIASYTVNTKLEVHVLILALLIALLRVLLVVLRNTDKRRDSHRVELTENLKQRISLMSL